MTNICSWVTIEQGGVMKILRYKRKKEGLYSVFLEKEKEYSFYEEVIIKHSLLLKKNLTEEELEELLKENKSYESYYSALSLINKLAKTSFEVKKYLEDKGFLKEDIENTITKLKKQGYLNDSAYAKSFVHSQLLTTSRGPQKIKDELRKKGIKEEDLKEALEEYTKEREREKISKIVNKAVKSNQRKSANALKKKLQMTLTLEGFDQSLISEALQKIEVREEEIAKKEYQKLYKKLSHKYSGKELEYKLKQKMYQLGFSYSDIEE